MPSLRNTLTNNVGTTPARLTFTSNLKNQTILGLNVCNKGTDYITVDGYLSNGSTEVYIFKNLEVGPATTVVAIGDNQRLLVDGSQELYIRASHNSNADVIVTLAENDV